MLFRKEPNLGQSLLFMHQYLKESRKFFLFLLLNKVKIIEIVYKGMVNMSFNQLKLEDIKKIYTKIYENACELIDEAEILLQHKKYARAYLSAHISVEEFGKLPMLHSVALNVHNGVKVDWKALNKRLRNTR